MVSSDPKAVESAVNGEFMSALKAEIASLESELEQDFRYLLLRELRRVLHLYGNATSSEHATLSKKERAVPEGKQSRKSVRRPTLERERALSAAKDYVANLDRVVPTREVLEHLMENGIEVGGSIPLNNLSALMSTSGQFQSHGRRGWTIPEREAASGAPPAPSDFDVSRDEHVVETATG